MVSLTLMPSGLFRRLVRGMSDWLVRHRWVAIIVMIQMVVVMIQMVVVMIQMVVVMIQIMKAKNCHA